MGRPPLKVATRTVKTTVRMDQPTIDRIVALVGENQMAKFIREAVEGELQKRERPKQAESVDETLTPFEGTEGKDG